MLYLTLLLAVAPTVHALTISVAPRAKFCFHEEITEEQAKMRRPQAQVAQFVYEVVRGGRHKDVIVTVESRHSPGGNKLKTHVTGHKTSSGSHTIPLDRAGLYTVCFDNGFSVVTAKVVDLDWVVSGFHDPNQSPSVKTAFEAGLDDLETHIGNMTHHLKKLRYRTILSADHALKLAYDVTFWSIATIAAIIVVCLTEVRQLQNLFKLPNSSKI